MRGWVSFVGVVLAATGAASSTAYPDLHGTVRAGTKPEPEAVVWLEGSRAATPVQTARVVLDQRNTTFSPRVLAVRVGTTVEFPNNDRVFHNVFSFHNGKRFDLGLYPVGTVKSVTFDHPGLSRVFCNIHPNMAAYIMVLDAAYFAVSNVRGEFVMPEVEPRSYTYRAWRPGRSDLTGTILVEPGVPVRVDWP
jgi:plastocyanin